MAGCTAKARPAVTPGSAPRVEAPAPAAPAAQPTPDPVSALIAVSNEHFEAGRRELNQGHLEQAKTEFNRALNVLLESPFGARSEPRIREHFDRLVEKISAYEVTALAEGDGFTEKLYEPASIDDLLAISTFEKAVPTAETRQAVAQDLQSTTHDIDIPMNAKVLSYVELFSGRLKGYLEDGLSRGARFLPMIQDVFRAEGLPLDLAYVPLVESAFKPNALSRASAKGMWQFMRGTALENGLKHDWYIDERAEPEKATRAAAKYLRTLYRMFGDWHLALASYNGGPGRMQRAMKRAGRDDFWALSGSTRYLPRETREYVPLILAAIIVARNPAQYGMNVVPLDAPAFERVTLSAAVDLRRVAEWTGASIDVVRQLNPELRRWTTPVRAKDYELKVPEGTADVVRVRLAQADPSDLAPLRWHTVKKGETLATIARKLRVTRADLAEANYLSVRSRVRVGQQLIIPRAPELLRATRSDTPVPAVGTRKGDVVVPAAARVSPRAEKSQQARVYYRVKRGDTLFSIAKRHNITVASLKSWNKIRGNVVVPGQRLAILTARTADE